MDIDDFNPRSPWGERRQQARSGQVAGIISIHAPRGGSDLRMWRSLRYWRKFQSTLPVGGATSCTPLPP